MKKYIKNPVIEYPVVSDHTDTTLGKKVTEVSHSGIVAISFWFTILLILLLLFAFVSITGYTFVYWNINFIYIIPIALLLTFMLAIINIIKVFKQRIYIYENGIWYKEQKILYNDLQIKGFYALHEKKSGSKLRFDVTVSPFTWRNPILEDLKKTLVTQ